MRLLTLDEMRALPEQQEGREQGPCIYFLWSKDGELLYIGATTDRNTRLARHWREKRYGYSTSGVEKFIPFERITILNCDRMYLWDWEHAYQRAYDAPYNVLGNQVRTSNA